jgi:hypothetical protein
MRPDIKPGATYPDYELPDHTRTQRRLSEIQGDEPMILTLARGHHCPKEHQLRHDLREVSAGIWPGWDLSTPGLRDAWDARDRSPCHDWNKRAPSAA